MRRRSGVVECELFELQLWHSIEQFILYNNVCCIEPTGAINIYMNLIFNIFVAYSVSPKMQYPQYANNCACERCARLLRAHFYYCLFGLDKCFEPVYEYENQQHGNNIYLCLYVGINLILLSIFVFVFFVFVRAVLETKRMLFVFL